MSNDKIDFLLDLDAKEFASKIDDAIKSVSELQGTLKNVATVAGVVGAAYLALKTSFSLALQAEELKSIQVQFENLAEQAGVTGDKILEGMSKASDGLIDTSDLMQLANRAFVQLGNSANKIPEIMEVSRKASILFGTSTEEAFQRITQAIATGQARQLKQLGVVVDTDQAYRNFAKSIGVAVSALTEQDKITAFQNAVLPQLQDKMARVQTNLKQTTDTWTKFGISIKEVGEAIAQTSVVDSFRNAWTTLLTTLTNSFNAFGNSIKATFGEGDIKAEGLRNRIKEVTRELDAAMNRPKELFNQNEVDAYTAKLKSLRGELQGLYTSGQAKDLLSAQPGFGSSREVAGAPSDPANERARLENQKKAQIAYLQELNQLKDQHLQAQILREQTETDVAKNMADQRLQYAANFELQRQQIEANQNLNEDQKNALKLQATQNLNDQMMALEDQKAQRTIAALDRQALHADSVFERIAAAQRSAALKGAAGQTQAFNLLNTGVNSFKANYESAFMALGAGTKNASDLVKSIFFGMLGDMAQQQGQFFMAQFVGSLGANVGALAGATAMFALAGFLKSQAGGGSVSAVNTAGAGTLATVNPGANGDRSEVTESASARERKYVNVVIQGNYLETQESKMWVAQALRDVTDATDIRITRA